MRNSLLLAAAWSIIFAACSSGTHGELAVPTPAATSLASTFSTFAAPSRLTLATGGLGFEVSRDGSDFAADLPNHNCDAVDPYGQYKPTWGVSSSGLNDAAYAVYQLELDAASTSTIELTWLNAVPTTGQAWLGLSNWDADAWEWRELPALADTVLPLADPDLYSNNDQQCLAAIVVLGTGPCQLESLGFPQAPSLTFPVVDTMQDASLDDQGQQISPLAGQAFYGQDAQFDGNLASYTDNGDGTISDNITGLMWAKVPNNLDKVSFSGAFTVAEQLSLGGHDDWRVPSIKELYSLIDFRGETGMSAAESTPYIDTTYFDFEYGDEGAGERHIDAQYWSSTEYVSTTMGGDATTFGVNFADGRIKGYGREHPMGGDMTQFIRCVRGNPDYGVNNFTDNTDGTVTDLATGLTWMVVDSGDLSAGPRNDGFLNWEEALAWAEGLDYADQTDWRLPNTKELQSIVDYTLSPATSSGPALDPVFSCTQIIDEGGSPDYGQYWSSTSHLDGPPESRGNYACYVAFGEGQGWMEQPPESGNYVFMDVHGAGCQRSDPKAGNPADYPYGHGPQGDVIRIYNLVRLVRGTGLLE